MNKTTDIREALDNLAPEVTKAILKTLVEDIERLDNERHDLCALPQGDRVEYLIADGDAKIKADYAMIQSIVGAAGTRS